MRSIAQTCQRQSKVNGAKTGRRKRSMSSEVSGESRSDSVSLAATVMLRLVRLGPILPRVHAAVDVARSDRANFRWSAPRESLDASHISHNISHNIWQIGEGGVDKGISDGHHRLRFACGRLTTAKTRNHCESLRDAGRKASFCHCPLKHANQPSHRRIDKRTAKPLADERLTDSLKLQDPKLGGGRFAIQLPNGSQHAFDSVKLTVGPAAVVGLRVLSVIDHQFGKRQSLRCGTEGWGPAGG